MNADEAPDPRSGYEVVGRLVLPGIIRAKLARLARARGLTPLGLVREIVAAWVLRQPEP